MDIETRILDIVDKVLLCIENTVFADLELYSWIHDVVELSGRGVISYRVTSYGTARKRDRDVEFIATTIVSGLGEEDLSPVETKFMLSTGLSLDLRPEVDLEKCLRGLIKIEHSEL